MSVDIRVMLRPRETFAWLFTQPHGRGAWVAFRRPLLVTVVLGCTISLVTMGSVSAPLVASSMVGFAFVPLAEILSLAVVPSTWRNGRINASFPVTLDVFFAGHAPWSLCLIGFAAFWSPIHRPDMFIAAFWAWACTGLAVVIWSLYIDLCFFRCVSVRPVRALMLQRLICWTLVVAVWCGGALPADVIGVLGL